MNKYTILKRTATQADVLAAVGAADLLSSFGPRLVDYSDRIDVCLRSNIAASDVADSDPGFRYLLKPERPPKPGNPERKDKTLPLKLPPDRVFDLALNSEKDKRQREAGKSKDASVAEAQSEDAPDPEYRMYSILGRMDAAGGPNGIVEQFMKLPREEWARHVWEGLNGNTEFVFEPSLVQLFNPHAAKGYSLLKPNGTDRNDKSKDKWAEPFVEWLRYRGYFHACAGWFSGKDIRVFCAIPGDIPYSIYDNVVRNLRELHLGGSAPKIDCRAMLGLARLLIARSEVYNAPNRWIHGVWIGHYQDMGQSNTLMAIDRLAIPDWFDLKTKDDAGLWLQTLDEHDKAIRRLTDNISEEFALLKQYRRFLQAQHDDALSEFIEFLVGYGLLLFRKRAQEKRWLLSQFTTESVEAILKRNMTYREILDNPGFRAVADALRSATVSAQAAKRNSAPDRREIRYGVLPEIRRKLSLGKDELAQTVADFVADFNAESARRYEMGKTGYRISESEFSAFAELLDQASSPGLVGSMLCALATCKRKTADDGASPEDEQEVSE